MITTSSGSDLLLERYPDLFFLLHYACDDTPLPPEEPPLTLPPLEPLSTLYIYGIGQGSYYPALQPWLQGSPERRVIILEDRLSSLKRLLDLPFLADPQVVIRYNPQIEDAIQQLMIDYPCDRIEVVSHSSYSGDHLRLELLRKSTLAHAATTESLQYHRLLENIIPNIRAWHGSFLASGLKDQFKNIPAVICGAGPSLDAHVPYLRTLEDKALLLAGGSAITALSKQGIMPHLGIAFDPNAEEFERLKQASAYEMPLIYGTRLEARVLNALNGERGYLVSGTGGPCESHFEQALEIPLEGAYQELGMEALSVTSLNLSLAVWMGCNPIFFSGVDLCYPNMQRYASGVLAAPVTPAQEAKASDKHLTRPDIHGRPVATLVKWVMESDCIAAFAAKYPHIRFINLSETSLGFSGIPNQSVTALEENFPSLDLRALVHAQIQSLKLPPLHTQIEEQIHQMRESLERLRQLVSAYLSELESLDSQDTLPTAKLLLLALDIEEELAFRCLNASIRPLQERLYHRFHPSTELPLKKQRAQFRQWKEILDHQTAAFTSAPVPLPAATFSATSLASHQSDSAAFATPLNL